MGSAQLQGELWGQSSSDWALLQEIQHTPLFEAMLNAAHVNKGTRLLDAGCGGGGASVVAAQRGAVISGLDASEGMIAVARERVPSGEFRVGDFQELPFDNDAFNAVIAPNSVQYAADRVAALSELGRVCEPPGRIVVALFAEAEKVEFRHIFKAMVSALPEPPAGDGPFGLSAPGKLEGLIEEAGLNIEESGEVDCAFSYPDLATFWRANLSAGPSQAIMRSVGEERLKEALQEAIEPYRTDDGGFHIAPNLFKYVVAVS